MNRIYDQVSKERYDIIQSRYNKFVEALNDPTKEPVRVFDPLSKRMIDELNMIREVSKTLQEKKDEEMRKAAAAASQAEEDAKKAAEEEKAKLAKEAAEEKETENAEGEKKTE